MKIVLISHSDLTGGAAVVTTRLMNALAAEGAAVNMLVSEKRSDDPRVHQLGSPAGRAARFLSERLHIFASNGFSRRDLFKVSIATRGYDVTRHPLVEEADAVIIGWINQGTLSLGDVGRIAATGKPVIWVMHDMWCLTGICHHACGCNGYERECGRCPFIHLPGAHSRDLSRSVHRRKASLYRTAASLRFVAVSSWLAGLAARSSLLSDKPVSVIPNPFPLDDFYTEPRNGAPDRKLIVMGAARLDDPIKELPTAINALNILADRRPDLTRSARVLFFGALREPSALRSLRFPYEHIGPVDDPAQLRELYASATAVLSTSRFETLPGTLIEGMAAGCTPVTFDSGGQRDIIEPGVTGYFAEYMNAGDVAQKLATALDTPFTRTAQRAAIASRFSAPAVARAYLHLLRGK